MTSVPVLLIVVPLAAAAVAALARTSRLAQRAVSLLAVAAVVGFGVALLAATADGDLVVTVVGGSEARYYIALTVDPFSALVVAAAGVVATAVLTTMMLRGDDHHPLLHPLVLVLLAGALGTFVTGDLFNLFVFFELTLLASYVLLVIGGRAEQTRAASVYVTVNLFGSLAFLAGAGLLYGATGTVNLAVLATAPPAPGREIAEVVIVVAFALKAALLPLGGWLRVAYPVVAAPVGALFGALLTTVGVVALYRVVPVAFTSAAVQPAVLAAGAATAVVAAVTAVAVPGRRRVLALVVMAQAGLMAVGVGLGGAGALAAGMVFVVQDVVAKAAAFLALGAVDDLDTGDRELATARPVLAAVIGVVLASLAGLPPTSGFVGKALLVRESLAGGAWAVAAAVLAASLAVLAAGVALWRRSAWAVPRGASVAAPREARRRAAVVPAAVLAAVVLAIGLVPGPLIERTRAAADILTRPDAYAGEVLE